MPGGNSSEFSSSHRITSIFRRDSGYGCSGMARLLMPVTMSVDGILSRTSLVCGTVRRWPLVDAFWVYVNVGRCSLASCFCWNSVDAYEAVLLCSGPAGAQYFKSLIQASSRQPASQTCRQCHSHSWAQFSSPRTSTQRASCQLWRSGLPILQSQNELLCLFDEQSLSGS
jgi:hypothetical protein